jgi:hypothetical protein
MTSMTPSTRNGGFRRALIAGAFGAVALGLTAAPALADTFGYYYDGPPTTVETPGWTTTTTTYYRTEPVPAYVYERERDRDRDHGAGIHLDTPILNFGIGFH